HKGRARAALFENVGECCIDPVRLASVEHARVLEGSSPRNASGHIVFEEATIEAERRAPLERRVIGRRVKTARPYCGPWPLVLSPFFVLGSFLVVGPFFVLSPFLLLSPFLVLRSVSVLRLFLIPDPCFVGRPVLVRKPSLSVEAWPRCRPALVLDCRFPVPD